MNFKPVLLAAAIAAGAGAAHAQTQAPGLWDHSFTMKYKFACTKPQRVSGEGQVRYVSEKAYTGRSTMTSQAAGLPQQMTMEMAGRWLGAECGDVKPVGALPAK